MKNSIVKSIKALPPLSKTISQVNKVCADIESGIEDLARVIETDPMIVANLLKAANSPLYGFSKKIINVSQAVSLFGMSMTRSIALGNAIRNLLNVDMQPYGVTSDTFAEVSSMQANLMYKWYSKIDKQKADKLYLGAFLQETGKILIASDIIEESEEISFHSAIELSTNIAEVEKSYIDVTSAEVTAEIFAYWKFDNDFVEMIKYSDSPQEAPQEIKEFATALHIVKTVAPINNPFSEQAVNFGLQKAQDYGYEVEILKNVIESIKGIQKDSNE